MAKTETSDQPDAPARAKKPLSPAAKRALEEAEARRRARDAQSKEDTVAEEGGRKGPDPARYGDWEKDGILSDF